MEDNDYEGVFLEKVPQKLEDDDDNQTFVVNDETAYSFTGTDILLKLPYPIALKRSSRRSNYFKFLFDFSKWDLAY